MCTSRIIGVTSGIFKQSSPLHTLNERLRREGEGGGGSCQWLSKLTLSRPFQLCAHASGTSRGPVHLAIAVTMRTVMQSCVRWALRGTRFWADWRRGVRGRLTAKPPRRQAPWHLPQAHLALALLPRDRHPACPHPQVGSDSKPAFHLAAPLMPAQGLGGWLHQCNRSLGSGRLASASCHGT